ncbi:symmetrical bis(5'-nucleosyl)-tetraphosphatase [Francisella philomiragia]|uniref:symmetrical bis(5'-nucleosyl)-tetraphosphatase n=1 Tax=Francisella philomiragia TaxID=28110 RepID=UPI0019059F23|nr:symmetrical bis(5'-nucleosyl)-tetraphosphatase [Francisella philomiragia]MBK2267918.1 symmetrical bis(5'-nucleosyl)-tetraphosphatase [Francisella philomiragia]MBK2279371.1 symmetrical bis(5'-nucleosyl)-tetraphosphatase [Francisella philomiragia]MBK2287225.1 symmetrical bis(5'-nucleosyl)-tetraphosphatase [Francisella philomiragia]MBK2289203.1 symmetrical bis(5'-nucleosyl)-tetraphosphatase [Francisella philomiragia]MBK2290921.1 symmetrical bis(5'-nucleosyl)-tetraphosphatase [Francisella philo
MATYVIGDVQGCYDELQLLLQDVKFDKHKDKLIFAGDILNKGPKSLEIVNFIMSLGESAQVVLGNHEILFLAVSYNYLPSSSKNTFDDILKAKNLKEVQEWLCNQSLLIKVNNTFIVHAGIPHIWSPKKALKRANEVEFVLKNSTTRRLLLANLFNNEMEKWNKELEGIDRWLCILNYFTRMRTIDKNGRLNLKFSSTIDQVPENFKPWFKLKHKKFENKYKIVFGHWAAIKGETKDSDAIALDTGCVFGGRLSCYCVETHKRYSIKALKSYKDI